MNLSRPTRGGGYKGQRKERRDEVVLLILLMAERTREKATFFEPTVDKVNTFVYIIQGLRGVNYESVAYPWGAYSPFVSGAIGMLIQRRYLRKVWRGTGTGKYTITELTEKGFEMLDEMDDRLTRSMRESLDSVRAKLEDCYNENSICLYPFVINLLTENPRILGDQALTLARLNGWHISLETFRPILRKCKRLVPRKGVPKWKN